jgi:hypothetical protein
LVEQRIENPRVGGSIPPQATKFQALDPSQDQGLFCFLALVVAFDMRFFLSRCNGSLRLRRGEHHPTESARPKNTVVHVRGNVFRTQGTEMTFEMFRKHAPSAVTVEARPLKG